MTDNRAEVAIEVDGDELTPIEPPPGREAHHPPPADLSSLPAQQDGGGRRGDHRAADHHRPDRPLHHPWAYDEIDRRAYLKPPSQRHPLGTTQGGRDMLALTLRGLRKSLLIGFLVAIISTSVRRHRRLLRRVLRRLVRADLAVGDRPAAGGAVIPADRADQHRRPEGPLLLAAPGPAAGLLLPGVVGTGRAVAVDVDQGARVRTVTHRVHAWRQPTTRHLAACIYSARIAQEEVDYADIFPVPKIRFSDRARPP